MIGSGRMHDRANMWYTPDKTHFAPSPNQHHSSLGSRSSDPLPRSPPFMSHMMHFDFACFISFLPAYENPGTWYLGAAYLNSSSSKSIVTASRSAGGGARSRRSSSEAEPEWFRWWTTASGGNEKRALFLGRPRALHIDAHCCLYQVLPYLCLCK